MAAKRERRDIPLPGWAQRAQRATLDAVRGPRFEHVVIDTDDPDAEPIEVEGKLLDRPRRDIPLPWWFRPVIRLGWTLYLLVAFTVMIGMGIRAAWRAIVG